MKLKNMVIHGENCSIPLSFIFELASSRLFWLSLHDSTGLTKHEYIADIIKLLDEICINLRESGHVDIDVSKVGDYEW